MGTTLRVRNRILLLSVKSQAVLLMSPSTFKAPGSNPPLRSALLWSPRPGWGGGGGRFVVPTGMGRYIIYCVLHIITPAFGEWSWLPHGGVWLWLGHVHSILGRPCLRHDCLVFFGHDQNKPHVIMIGAHDRSYAHMTGLHT